MICSWPSNHHLQYNLSIATLPVTSCIRVISKAMDGEIPPKLKLSPKILEKVGAGKMVCIICIEYPLSVDSTPFSEILISALKSRTYLQPCCMYVNIFCSVSMINVCFLKYIELLLVIFNTANLIDISSDFPMGHKIIICCIVYSAR